MSRTRSVAYGNEQVRYRSALADAVEANRRCDGIGERTLHEKVRRLLERAGTNARSSMSKINYADIQRTVTANLVALYKRSWRLGKVTMELSTQEVELCVYCSGRS